MVPLFSQFMKITENVNWTTLSPVVGDRMARGLIYPWQQESSHHYQPGELITLLVDAPAFNCLPCAHLMSHTPHPPPSSSPRRPCAALLYLTPPPHPGYKNADRAMPNCHPWENEPERPHVCVIILPPLRRCARPAKSDSRPLSVRLRAIVVSRVGCYSLFIEIIRVGS